MGEHHRENDPDDSTEQAALQHLRHGLGDVNLQRVGGEQLDGAVYDGSWRRKDVGGDPCEGGDRPPDEYARDQGGPSYEKGPHPLRGQSVRDHRARRPGS